MKKEVLYFIMGIFMSFLFGFKAASYQYRVVMPQKPKYTVVCHTNNCWKEWVKKGYQIQGVSAGSGGRITYVMVKYD